MKISFIIKFHNEGLHMQKCVSAILEQKGDFEKEFIFVNDNSTDESIDFVKNFEKNHPENTTVKIINLAPNSFTYASSANIALPEVTGELICVITVHTEIKNNDALLVMSENFIDPKVVGVYSRSVSGPKTTTFEKLAKVNADYPYKITRSEEFMSESDKNRIGNYTFVGTFCLIRASVLKENPYHELPRAEDLEWAHRMIKQGYKIVFEPRSQILHYDNDPVEKLIWRWLTSITALNLIITKRVPGRISLIKSAIMSWNIFMLRVAIKESNLIQKLKYLFNLIQGNIFILSKSIFKYNKLKIWQSKYNNSLKQI